MSKNVYLVNAFTYDKKGGNPAGVCVDANDLSDEQMQSIAAKMGVSETAFVLNSDKADFRLRFFTPTAEVDLCGHATIATFATLFQDGVIQAGSYVQETKAGLLDLQVEDDGSVFMEQSLPVFGEEIRDESILKSLSIHRSNLIEDLPIQVVSTGLRDIIIPVKKAEILSNLDPDFQLIDALSEKYDVVGYHIFTLDCGSEVTARCRNFAPRFGIPEESATGTSSGALAAYLFHHRKITSSHKQKLVFHQGLEMGQLSEIEIHLDVDGDKVKKVVVGGSAIRKDVIKVQI